jgi:hypothetical protein
MAAPRRLSGNSTLNFADCASGSFDVTMGRRTRSVSACQRIVSGVEKDVRLDCWGEPEKTHDLGAPRE